jgi:hypothetical protein
VFYGLRLPSAWQKPKQRAEEAKVEPKTTTYFDVMVFRQIMIILLAAATTLAMTLPQTTLQHSIGEGLLGMPAQVPNLSILGTVHLGSESAKEAVTLIERVRPTIVVLEVAPSRLERLRLQQQKKEAKDSTTATAPPIDLGAAFFALADRGWQSGGFNGFLFATVVIWSGLKKRTKTVDDEIRNLPRTDEFAAALAAADSIGAQVVAADLELDELIQLAARLLTPLDWIKLGKVALSETFGLSSPDPVQRRKNETIHEWALRRRDIATARASRSYGEETNPGFARLLVDERDALFSECCRNACDTLLASSGDGGGGGSVVCVVGLVHLDGIMERFAE